VGSALWPNLGKDRALDCLGTEVGVAGTTYWHKTRDAGVAPEQQGDREATFGATDLGGVSFGGDGAVARW